MLTTRRTQTSTTTAWVVKPAKPRGTATSSYQYAATTLRPTLETITYDLNRDGNPELTRQLDLTHDNRRRSIGFTLK